MIMEKKETYNKNEKFTLCIIDDQSSDLYQILGITDERAQELEKVCFDAFSNYSQKTQVYGRIFNECKHINEVTLAVEILQSIVNKHKIQQLGSLFGKILGNDEGEDD